jgi:hypothetical protein
MVVLAKTSNKLIRIRGFHIDYLGHAHSVVRTKDSGILAIDGFGACLKTGAFGITGMTQMTQMTQSR